MDFANNVQLSLTLAALSVGLWWTFDRSRSGFGLGVIITILATLVTQLLVYNGVFQWASLIISFIEHTCACPCFIMCSFMYVCRYTSPDFLYIRSWLPCIFFAGVITVGNIGRQLALVNSHKHSQCICSLDHRCFDAFLFFSQYEHKVTQEKIHQD